ncbi:hypothetical protein B9Z19DRAFT_1189521 [Tuber borchii]|uniref:Uncharacterized protein n=1 Tax=Tuber borchii TaxID=42251 RepID=A0A2T7A7A5_TUBBO|nr:hypothetical protein B9Z19DRAFT_1189521 [Tuber borchii]
MSDTKPSSGKTMCIWALCLSGYYGEAHQVMSRLGEIKKGLRGYLGDKETKGNLVRDLVLPFTSKKTRILAGNGSAEAELFKPGALPTADGRISTVPTEIMSLASEVGDSSLVYKFMSVVSIILYGLHEQPSVLSDYEAFFPLLTS